MSRSTEFADACRAEWERLGVARDRLAAMRDELERALAGAPGGDLPAEIGGRSTADARAFADAWADEHGATRPPLRYSGLGGRSRRRAGFTALAVLLGIGFVAAFLEFRAPDDPTDSPTSTVQTTFVKPDLVRVPNLVGSPLDVATQTAQRLGVRIGDVIELADAQVARDTVLKVEPQPGTRLARGTAITLTVAK